MRDILNIPRQDTPIQSLPVRSPEVIKDLRQTNTSLKAKIEKMETNNKSIAVQLRKARIHKSIEETKNVFVRMRLTLAKVTNFNGSQSPSETDSDNENCIAQVSSTKPDYLYSDELVQQLVQDISMARAVEEEYETQISDITARLQRLNSYNDYLESDPRLARSRSELLVAKRQEAMCRLAVTDLHCRVEQLYFNLKAFLNLSTDNREDITVSPAERCEQKLENELKILKIREAEMVRENKQILVELEQKCTYLRDLFIKQISQPTLEMM